MNGRRFLVVLAIIFALVVTGCSGSSDDPSVPTNTTATATTRPAFTKTVTPSPITTKVTHPTTIIVVPLPGSTQTKTTQVTSKPPVPSVATVTSVAIEGVRILRCDPPGAPSVPRYVQLEVKFAVAYVGKGEVRVMFGGDPSHPDDSYGRALYSVTDQANPYRAVLTISPPSPPVHTLVVSAYGADNQMHTAVRSDIACD